MRRPAPFYPPPEPGDILWCRFPKVEGIRPGPKPRPCIVSWVSDAPEAGQPYRVLVIYGTSSFRSPPRPTELDLDPDQHRAAYQQAGLSQATRFDLGKAVVVNYDEMYFALAPNGNQAPGPTPRLGVLHPSRYRALQDADRAVAAKGLRSY